MELSSGAVVKRSAASPCPVTSEASMLMRRWRQFTTSGEPARFFCFDDQGDGKWVEVDAGVAHELRRAFRDRRVFAEVAYGGRAFLFDFLRMARIDEATAEQAGMGWIDHRGALYFPAPDYVRRPRKRAREDDSDAESSSEVEERARDGDKKKAKNTARRGASWKSAPAMAESERDYQLVSRLFLDRGMAPRGAEVTAVRRVAPGARAADFQLQAKSIAARRGAAAAGARFAWYGAPAEDVAAAVEQGITRTNAAMLGALAHGDGVHLAPPQHPYACAVLAKADETGEAHIVLCRILMGRPEAVPAGSSQSQPSSDAYDSAVDTMANPHWYVLWSKDMKTRILPEFVVSFKCPNLHVRESSEATSKLRNPSSPEVTPNLRKPSSPEATPNLRKPSSPVSRDMFPKVLAELENLVPHKCDVLQETYERFKKGQIKKEQFTRFLRNYVGDKMLATVAKKLRGN